MFFLKPFLGAEAIPTRTAVKFKMGDHELVDAEDLATGNEEDDRAILRLLENKQKETQARMDRIDKAFSQLRIPRTHGGRLTK